MGFVNILKLEYCMYETVKQPATNFPPTANHFRKFHTNIIRTNIGYNPSYDHIQPR